MPIIWHWFSPAFNFTAAVLMSTQAATGIPWLPFIIGCGFGVRLCLAPLMLRQMALINKMSHASPNIRITAKLFKFAKMPLHQRLYHGFRACVDYARQTNTSLGAFYFYNIVQIPVFILMVMSIRKIATENEDLTGAGCLWFPNLNEPDAYLILPIIATLLNYFNLGVSLCFCLQLFREASRKTMNTGSLTASVLSSRSFSFSICHSPTHGPQVPSSTG
jgi:membrane protein insertase Oxa1/YidC/SpoIIIJ